MNWVYDMFQFEYEDHGMSRIFCDDKLTMQGLTMMGKVSAQAKEMASPGDVRPMVPYGPDISKLNGGIMDQTYMKEAGQIAPGDPMENALFKMLADAEVAKKVRSAVVASGLTNEEFVRGITLLTGRNFY